jgi:hypothetical protein
LGKKKYRNFNFPLVLYAGIFFTILIAYNPTRCFAGKRIAILPFNDDSGFKGKWNLKLEIPKLLGRVLSSDSLFQRLLVVGLSFFVSLFFGVAVLRHFC